MGIRGDVLDLTDLQRRGLLKKSEMLSQSQPLPPRTSDGYFDLSRSASQLQSQPSFDLAALNTPKPTAVFDLAALNAPKAPEPPQNSDPNPLSFLDLPGPLSPTPQVNPPMPDLSSPSTPFLTNPSVTPLSDSLELQGLKNKIDDLEYKLDRLMEKFSKLDNKI